MKINNLSDLSLLAIFDQLPLGDFIQLHKICCRWKLLQVKAGLTRHQVTLLHGPEAINLMSDVNHFAIPQLEETTNANGKKDTLLLEAHSRLSIVECAWLDEKTAQWIGAILPNVNSLYVVQNRISSASIQPVINLLRQWSAKLLTLKVWGSYQEELPYNEERLFIASNVFNLLHATSSLTSLQHLTLQCTLDIASTAQQPVDLPILSQLHQFNFYCINDTADAIVGSLSRYATTNDQLQQIALVNSVDSSASLNRFLRLSPQLAARFTQLSVAFERRDDLLTSSQLSQLSEHFASLASLSLDIGALSLSQLSTSLSPLAELLHLNLSIDFTASREAFSVDDHMSSTAIGRLGSVRVLTLRTLLNSHNDMNSRHLAWIFPRLQVLRSRCYIKQCRACQGAPLAGTLNCLQMAIQPWRQCAQLRKVVDE